MSQDSIDAPTPVLDLIPGDAPFNPQQRAWLNGFFSAVLTRSRAEGSGAAADAQAASTAPAISLQVFYASQTGTAEGLARKLVKQAKQKGYDAKAAELSSFGPDTFAAYADAQADAQAAPQAPCYALIIASTYGEGAPPDSAAGWQDSFSQVDATHLGALR